MNTPRSLPIYVVTGLMLALTVTTGAFLVVWCGTFRFLFSGWQGIVIIPLLAFIAWRSFEAARDAWAALPSAPPSAMAALIAVELLILLVQLEGRFAGNIRGISVWTLLPHAAVLGLITLMFFLNPAFDGHMIETEAVFDVATYADDVLIVGDDDDDDLMYLGGA